MKGTLKTLSAILLIAVLSSCSLLFGPTETKTPEVTVDSITLSQSSVSVAIGGVVYLTTRVIASADNYTVSYLVKDESLITIEGDTNGLTISGVKPGTTTVKAVCGNKSTTVIVTVTGEINAQNNPYISLPVQVITLANGYDRNISAVLEGGSYGDMSSFVWTIDNTTVASVTYVGQNANIKANAIGITKLTCSHPKASYPTEMMVIVKDDNSQASYITTSQNVITAKRGVTQNINVSLVDIDDSRAGLISWSVDKPEIVSISGNGKAAIITPNTSGEAKITVNHPDALFPTTIIVRVIALIENVYIEVPQNTITVTGTAQETLTVNLKGSASVEGDITGFNWTIDNTDCVNAVFYQNSAVLTGKMNGTAKITISNDKAQYAREIMVIVNGQSADSINTNYYLSSSQTYMRFVVGGEDQLLNVLYYGGSTNDENDLEWSIDNPSIASITAVNGNVISRAISQITNVTKGQLKIKALSAGEAVITVSHPKVLNPLKILVQVV